jgi:hypothetical protein
MRNYENNIHLSRTEITILTEIISDYIKNDIDCKDPQRISNLTRINALGRLYKKINEKHYMNKGWGNLDWDYIFNKWKIDLIRANRDKLLQIQSKHIVRSEYKDIHHLNAYEKLKIELSDEKIRKQNESLSI